MSRDGYPFRDTWPWAEGVLDAFGPDRTIWASDWPLAGEHATYRQLRDLVDELPFVDGAARTAMLSDDAGPAVASSGCVRPVDPPARAGGCS